MLLDDLSYTVPARDTLDVFERAHRLVPPVHASKQCLDEVEEGMALDALVELDEYTGGEMADRPPRLGKRCRGRRLGIGDEEAEEEGMQGLDMGLDGVGLQSVEGSIDLPQVAEQGEVRPLACEAARIDCEDGRVV